MNYKLLMESCNEINDVFIRNALIEPKKPEKSSESDEHESENESDENESEWESESESEHESESDSESESESENESEHESEHESESSDAIESRTEISFLIQLFINKNLIKEISYDEFIIKYKEYVRLKDYHIRVVVLYDKVHGSFDEIYLSLLEIEDNDHLKENFTIYEYMEYSSYSLTSNTTTTLSYTFQHLIIEILVTCKSVTKDTLHTNIICIYKFTHNWGLYYYTNNYHYLRDHKKCPIIYKNLDEFIGFEVDKDEEDQVYILHNYDPGNNNFTHFTFEFFDSCMNLI